MILSKLLDHERKLCAMHCKFNPNFEEDDKLIENMNKKVFELFKRLIEQRFGFNRNPDHKFSLLVKRTFHKGIETQEQAEYLKKDYLWVPQQEVLL